MTTIVINIKVVAIHMSLTDSSVNYKNSGNFYAIYRETAPWK